MNVLNHSRKMKLILTMVFVMGAVSNGHCSDNMQFADGPIVDITKGEESQVEFFYQCSSTSSSTTTINFLTKDSSIVNVVPAKIIVNCSSKFKLTFLLNLITSKRAGETYIKAIDENETSDTDVLLVVRVNKESYLLYFHDIVGWMYFACWSFSFYPQIYDNYKRKSVVGLNFDFISLNIIGYVTYSLFNCGLYFIPSIQALYKKVHEGSVVPVPANDVLFAVHGLFLSSFTAFQCIIYERSSQKISMPARFLIILDILIVFVTAIMAYFDLMTWLNFITYSSYIKLSITTIKYIPQAYMNYQRKSTVGWSIFAIFLDLGGSIFSLLQMCIHIYNYEDWEPISGDFAKFGLGMVSTVFDLIFIYQHYVLYSDSKAALPTLNKILS